MGVASPFSAISSWQRRDGLQLDVPKFVREVIERIAFAAREDKKIDKRSGVSQRLPISVLENAISSAEQRALRNHEKIVVPRVSDIYSAMPAITGKLELEYEGEMKGADNVARELIRAAVAKAFDSYFNGANMQQIVQWFDLGGEIKLPDSAAAAEIFGTLKNIQGLSEKLNALGVQTKDLVEHQVAAAEFVLEGLYAHKRIGRSEERVFSAGEKPPRRPEPEPRPDQPFRGRRSFN